MRILYLSCHSILEYDEVKLLHELGHEVFSPGAYVEPDNPGDATLRPGITGLKYKQEWLDAFSKIGKEFPGQDSKDHLTQELVDMFDCIIVMHLPRWLLHNFNVLKGKRVIWRTIGQSISHREKEVLPIKSMLNLQIVRYSPRERTIPNFIGEDALIRFYKDPAEYGPWNGEKPQVISFAQHMERRNQACNYTFFEAVTRPFNRHLFGPGNEGKPWTTGKVPYERLLKEMRDNRVYFYTGTHPASYTLNFMEAWMTGMPIVAIGPKNGNANYFPGHNLYEVHELIDNGVNGFVSDSAGKLKEYITTLLNDHDYAHSISEQARKKAIEIFGKETIKQQWRKFLDD